MACAKKCRKPMKPKFLWKNLRANRSKITTNKRIRIMKGDEVRVHKKEFLTPSN